MRAAINMLVEPPSLPPPSGGEEQGVEAQARDRALVEEHAQLYDWMRRALDRKRRPPYPVIEAIGELARSADARHQAERLLFTPATDFQQPPADLAILPDRRLTLADLAARAHIKLEDARTALTLMGFLDASPAPAVPSSEPQVAAACVKDEAHRDRWAERCQGEVVMPMEVVLKACEVYGVRTQGVLDEQYCL